MSITREDKVAQAREMVADLNRLIEALDRRVPRLSQVGEAEIARDADDLRERALAMIRRIESDLLVEYPTRSARPPDNRT